MRKTLGVCLLVLLLTGPAVAGEMPNGSPAPPPPSPQTSVAQGGYMPNGSPTLSQPTSAVEETRADGWMGSGATASLTQVAWELFAVFPSLL